LRSIAHSLSASEGGRDHARARKLGGLRQCVALKPHQIGDEQEKPARPCGELARAEHEVADIGDSLRIGTDADGTLLIEPARQGCKALRGEHLAHRGGAQRHALFLERRADLVDRVVALAQGHDLVMRAALLGLLVPARPRGSEELRQDAATKGVAQHPEGPRRIAEAPCHIGRGQFVHIKGTQSLVLALPRRRGFSEEASAIR
jgi:hypothetical protein